MKDRVLGIVTHVMVMAIVIAVILLFMGIIILILFHLCITGGVFGRGLENDGTVDRGSLGSSSMSRDDVEKLPCFDYKDKEKGSGSSSSADCAVCLEDFKAGEKCRLLPLCKHSFHANCVDSWLLITPFCPICRTCAGSNSGEEEIRPRLDEIVIELRESQSAESQQLSVSDIGLSETVESSHSGGFVIELGDNQTETRQLSETVELGVSDSQTTKSGDLNDVGSALRGNQMVEHCVQSVQM